MSLLFYIRCFVHLWCTSSIAVLGGCTGTRSRAPNADRARTADPGIMSEEKKDDEKKEDDKEEEEEEEEEEDEDEDERRRRRR